MTPMLPPARIIVFASSYSRANSIRNSKTDITRIRGTYSVTVGSNYNKVYH